MSSAERDGALQNVQNVVNEYGTDIKILLVDPQGVEYDEYEQIKLKKGLGEIFNTKAHDFILNPTEEQIEKAGLRLRADCLAYTATKNWTDAGKTLRDINSALAVIEANEEVFDVKEKVKGFSNFQGSWLYIVFGGIRRG
jgi:bifunctional ADP-heptose synthase (sugar kinase/adenylyltransferase)